MEGMNGGQMSGMNGSTTTTPHRHKMMMMHMTFYWGTCTESLFSGWPGAKIAMYAVALLFIFALCVLVEWLSHCHLLLAVGVFRSLLHALRMGLAYLVMLALMSFNAGVFLAAVAWHAAGFQEFGSRAFGRPGYAEEATSDLPPMSC